MASAMRGISSSHVPRNVEQITKAASDYDYNQQVPLRYWLRTAVALPDQARIYAQEGDIETTYLLLFRHAHLVLAHLVTHPDAKEAALKAQLIQARKEVDRNLETLDALKPQINRRYENYVSNLQQRETRRQTQTQNGTSALVGDLRHWDEHTQDIYQSIDGQLHPDLAVKLAQQEFNRRADVRLGPQPTRHASQQESDDLSQRIRSVRSHLVPDKPALNTTKPQSRAGNPDKQREYNYPEVHNPKPQQDLTIRPKPLASPAYISTQPPTLPPKLGTLADTQAPIKPGKVEATTATSTPAGEPKYTFKSTASLENGAPLRTIFLPPTLRTTFLRLAYKNTMANLETCGFLAGSLVSNALFVSKLIVPAQVSTSDTCEMTNESQLFDYVDSQNDLMILGWIHTHPTQTCFMSSRDLHTHAGYQMMLAESIAIVCAPSKGDTTHGGDWGAFRLTDPPGKMAILNCSKPGLFHPHDVDNVYTDALRPGHVVEAKGLEFEIVDLR